MRALAHGARLIGGVLVTLALLVAGAAPARAQPALHAALAERAVTSSHFLHRDLYSWTSAEQARALRRDRELLISGPADGPVRAPYQRALDELARTDGAAAELARVLTEHPALRRRRYAWPTPYGTVIPRGSRGYGPVLLHIRMRADALTLRFAPEESPVFRAVDGEGRPVPVQRVLSDPTRIGAVLHVRHRARMGPYREYIVHGQVERWSLGTDAIRARVDDDLRVLRRLRRVPTDRGTMTRHWRSDPTSLAGRYAVTMPFDTLRHRPSPETVSALAEALRARRPRAPALTVELGDD